MSRPPRHLDELVLGHQGVVYSVAWKIHRGLPPWVEFDDIAAVGQLGLSRAATNFDPSRGFAFSTYAYHRVRGEILDYLRMQRWFSTFTYFEGGYAHAATEADDDVDREVVRLEHRLSLYQAMLRLSEEERSLIRLAYFDGLSLSDAAERLGISRSWCSRLHGRALSSLRSSLPSAQSYGEEA